MAGIRSVDAKDSFQYLLFNTRSTGALEGYAKGREERKGKLKQMLYA